jgi:hypothetical protein
MALQVPAQRAHQEFGTVASFVLQPEFHAAPGNQE